MDTVTILAILLMIQTVSYTIIHVSNRFSEKYERELRDVHHKELIRICDNYYDILAGIKKGVGK